MNPEIYRLLLEDRIRMIKLVCRVCARGDMPSSTDLGVYHTVGVYYREDVRCPAEKIHEAILCLPVLNVP